MKTIRPTPLNTSRITTGFKSRRLPVAIVIAIAAAPGVQAQDAPLDEVMVTGSRIRTTSGMETPNPVTVVTMDQLAITSPNTLIEGMSELPQFTTGINGSSTTSNTGGFFTTSGAGSLSLRGLASKRTLQLLSGRRVVSSTIYGGPDINLFPESMLRSVETVTGGATAAYGTDAVSGVVNFILDTGFTGYRGGVQYGENYNGDNENYEVKMSGGWDIGENGHLLLSAEKFDQDAIWTLDGYDWYRGAGMLTNPSATAGQTPDNPLRLPYDNVVSRRASYDGIIEFPAASGLGVYSVDAGGNASPFVLGSASDTNFHSIANGGSGTDNYAEQYAQIQPETGRENIFGYVDYDLMENLNVFGQVIYGEASFTNRNDGGRFGPGRSFTIYSGNPYLPANIQALMTANNVPSVTLGRIGHNSDLAAAAYTTQDTEMLSLTTGFNWTVDSEGFFNGWGVNGYLQKGETEVAARQRGGIRIDRVYLAADAVRDAGGNIVCNVTLVSGQYQDCEPINLFGRGRASAEAVDWSVGFDPGIAVNTQGWLPNGQRIPYSYTGTDEKSRIIELEQDVVEIAADGRLFEGFGAGPISMALGYTWREENFIQLVQAPQGNTTTDPDGRPVAANDAALGIRGVPGGAAASGNSVEIQFSKVPFGIGDFTVKEAFTEFEVPLLSGIPFIEQFDANLAARWANYSGSGDVWSWKIGLDWRITEEVRTRGTVSQDVRAATLGERYDRTGGVANVVDYGEDPNGATTSTYSVTTVAGGNPNVRPEEAKTFTAGLVYQPRWLEGLQMSFDWYNVDVGDNINQIGANTIVDNCYRRGDVDACALIERDGPPSSINPGINRISIVNDVFVNINSVEAQGVDFEVSYGTDIDLFGGGERVGLRLLGSKLQHNTTRNSAGSVTHLDGQSGLPHWNVMLTGSYTRGPLSTSVQLRHEDATVQSNVNNIFQTSLNRIRYDIPNNDVSSTTLVDARIGYDFAAWGSDLNVFLSVNNLFNRDPVPFVVAPDAGLTQAVGNGVVGDLRGRRFVLGVNFDF